MEDNSLYREFDKLLSKQGLDNLLDEWWRRYPRIYEALYRKGNHEAYKMLELLMDYNPKIFNSLMTRALEST